MKHKNNLSMPLILTAIAFAITGCGGGNTSPSATLGQKLNFSGTVAIGQAVSNGELSVTCASGVSAATTTKLDGSYAYSTLDNLPCSFSVKLPNGQFLRSIASTDGIINVTPLTELGYQLANGDAKNLDSAKITLKNVLAQQFGIRINNDHFTTAFSANSTGVDFEIEKFSARIGELYPNTSGAGSTSSITSYVTDVKNGANATSTSTLEATKLKAILINIAVGTLKAIDNTLPSSYVIDTNQYLNQPDFVRIVGGATANAWNYLVALPVDAGFAASNDLTESLTKLGHKDALTGKIVWDTSKLGAVAWDILKVSAAGFGAIASPGKPVGALCSTVNDLSNGGDLGVSYTDNQTYCASLSSITDIFFSSKEFITNAGDIGIAAGKFKTSWITQFNNNTNIMKIARQRSLQNMFKGAFAYARSISDVNDAFSVNNLNSIQQQYSSLLQSLGFSMGEILAVIPKVECPSGTIASSDGSCLANQQQFSENFNGTTLDATKWTVESLGGNLATYTASGGFLNITVPGGSCGFCGTSDGARFKPMVQPLAGDFQVTLTAVELERLSRDLTRPISTIQLLLTAGSTELGIYVVGDVASNQGTPGHKIITYYRTSVETIYPSTRHLSIGEYYSVQFRIRRANGISYLAYKLESEGNWTEVIVPASFPAAVSLMPTIVASSGDGGGTRTNSSFRLRFDEFTIAR